MSESAQQAFRYVHDVYRRPYRVGETDRALLGRPRASVAAVAVAAMAAAGLLQYGYVALLPALAQAGGWSSTAGLWAFALWAACHAGALGPTAWLRSHQAVSSRMVVAVGLVLCSVALLNLAYSVGAPALLFGYSIIGGIGSGAVYGTCLSVVAAWYPERPTIAAMVSGAFCYGALPLVTAFAFVGAPELPLKVAAAALACVALACVVTLTDPPAHWWPSHIDPQRWSTDRAYNPALHGNRPAVKHYQPGEVTRCGAAGWMYLLIVCASAMALFDLVYLAPLASSGQWSLAKMVAVAIVFIAACGLVRTPVVLLGDRWGRARTLASLLWLGALSQVILLAGVESAAYGLVIVATGAAGAAAGTGYALVPGLVRSYFGEAPGLPNFAVLYSAKLVGALLAVVLAVLSLAWGSSVGFMAATALAVIGAVVAKSLRRPGLPGPLLPHGLPTERNRMDRTLGALNR